MMRLLAALLAALTMNHPYTSAGVDHILLGASSLDDGIRVFERATGVMPLRGGRHPNRGTENALVSLGHGTYLEIIAPQAGAAPDEMVTALRKLERPALVGWAVHVVDVHDAAGRLARAGFTPSKPQPGSRVTPEGATLEWTTFGLQAPSIESAPFFIQWGAATKHPSLTSPGGCELVSFHVGDPNGDALQRLVGALGVKGAEVRKAEHPSMRLVIRCGAREAAFDTPSLQ